MTRAPAGSFWTVVGVFGLFGPFIGGAVLVLLEVLRGGALDIGVSALLLAASPAAGMLPALAAGLLAGALSSRIDSRLLWVLTGAALGAGAAGLLLGVGGVMPLRDMLAVGGAAGLGAAALSLPVRPRWR